jgi:hypothetical protein
MAKGMRRCPFGNSASAHRKFQGLLHMGFVQMPAPRLFRGWNQGKRLCREQPLPNQFFGGVFIFSVQRFGQENTSGVRRQILLKTYCDNAEFVVFKRNLSNN